MDLEKQLHIYFPFGIPVSAKTWEWLELEKSFDQEKFSTELSTTFAIRKLADKYNLECVHAKANLWPIRPGQLVTASVITDVLRFVLWLYSQEENPRILSGALGWMDAQRESQISFPTIQAFTGYFPPPSVLRGESPDTFIEGSSELGIHKEAITRESILLSLSTANPAFKPFRPLFDDSELVATSPFKTFITSLEAYFEDKPPFAKLGESLFDVLRAPMEASPNSLEGQLDYIKTHWASFLPKSLLSFILLAADILQEEQQIRGWGPGANTALEFGKGAYGRNTYDYPEPDAFSRDADWMSNVVIIAKSIYVWMDQLSKKYGRSITHLDEIPDEELAQLARWGFNGLWLIGVWERSRASQKIKQIMGNPEAAPSAYSLYDYIIAHDLGGEEAYQNLRSRAWRYGIRLASDMVPNHMGIYSKWVIEHPDWFIQSSYPPFPVYQFTGVNLSEDDSVTIQIEDGYWEHRDAAVVFKRTDNRTGEVRYIYHGNDGTSTPWNDTAQLNFMKQEVREAVIQVILHVARKFPIIRFDAAMTLAKKHYQRLWFPRPGEGGAIPSRAEHSMSQAEFDAVFPKEFWREVVDRVTAEMPDTLLLAEAFWLMEGYFVRTLGMHRVYNSAFMNMLKMEDNAKYRKTVMNVLEFSPEILKRFVNFMNNPDEKTAVEQFGKGDKYFGIAMMMVTMPGLPMFGHGQIEGFSEKYGMEYYRAYWDEQVDEDLVRRHEREIFPLMHRRSLFSGSRNFAFYDFTTPDGWVNENVFAYTNVHGKDRAVIIYNNSYDKTVGKIHTSTAINIGPADEKRFIRKSLADGLNLNTSDRYLYRFTDYRTGLQYLRSGAEIAQNGLFVDLQGYQYHAFLDFEEIFDADDEWTKVMNRLSGGGVPDLEDYAREVKYEALLIPFRKYLENLFAPKSDDDTDTENKTRQIADSLREFFTALEPYMPQAKRFTSLKIGEIKAVITRIKAMLGKSKADKSIVGLGMALNIVHILLVLRHIGNVIYCESSGPKSEQLVSRLKEWLLLKAIREKLSQFLKDDWQGDAYAGLLLFLLQKNNFTTEHKGSFLSLNWTEIFNTSDVRSFLQVHEYEGYLWFNKEQLELFVGIVMIVTLLDAEQADRLDNKAMKKILTGYQTLLDTASKTNYKLADFLDVTSEYQDS